jgi:hypothetical protein
MGYQAGWKEGWTCVVFWRLVLPLGRELSDTGKPYGMTSTSASVPPRNCFFSRFQ